MAEEPLLTYVGKFPSNIISLLPYKLEELKAVWGFEHELDQLRDSLDSIADLVEDAEQKQRRVVAARQWLRNLRDVAYEADDLLSELAYETTRLRIQNQEVRYVSSISRAIHNVRKAKFRLKIAPKLKRVNQSLNNIQRDSLSLQLTSTQRNLEDIMSQNMLPIDSIIDSPVVVGRKVDVAQIVNKLTSSYHEQLTVVSIVGVGGIGKTTLAQLVCQKVMALTWKPFDVNISVPVSPRFSEQFLLRKMLQSVNASMQGLTNDDAILQQLKKELANKKLLLVLEDVWHQDWHWGSMQTLFSKICTNNGNVILLTTRNEDVAINMGTSRLDIYWPGLLSDDECWLIFKESAFRNIATQVPSNLEAMGREIAKTCGGLPLAAKVLGWTMGFYMDEEIWLKIRDNIFSDFDISSILEASFDYLPLYLKSCFAFCSIFPEDFLIGKEELIWLWMGEGFVKSREMGNVCFDALLASAIFKYAKMDDDGDVMLGKMNDCVHHHQILVSESEILTYIYHFYAYPEIGLALKNVLKGRANKLRTIILGGASDQEIRKMKKLRSLQLKGADIEELSSSIRKMKHLRYLDVSISRTKELPESISKLYNLQTLNLSNSSIKELPEFVTKLYNLQTLNLSKTNIKELPGSITKLHNLQTLNVSKSNIKELPESIIEIQSLQTLKFIECKELTKRPRKKINNLINLKHIAFSYEHQMPLGLGKLNGLETLLFFVVGPDWGGSIQELECLNELRGDLKITRLEEAGNMNEVKRANMQGKAKLQGLSFQWSSGENDRRDKELLEGLQPHSNIKRLHIKYYAGGNWPSWMLRMKSPSDSDYFVVLNNVVDLRLEWCSYCVQLPCLGDLPHLKFLKMNHLGKVKSTDNEFYGIDNEGSNIRCMRFFPALKTLSVSWMENLTEWSSPLDGNKAVVFPCLENLSIQFCPKLTGFPMSDMSELVKLEIRDCEELRLLTDKQQSFAFLTSLSIVGCSKFTDLQNWLLSHMSFKELSVRRCEWLTFIPKDLGKVSYLTSLEIYCCKRLRHFSEEIICKLTQLQNLSVGAFSEELDDFHYLNGIKDLPCLEELEIWGSDFFGREMGFLPNQIQHLTVLKSLKIIGFTTMEALPEWLVNLQSLRSLSLDYCRHLGYQSTATVIQRLSNLTHLNINCCPILEESKLDLLRSLDTMKIKVEFSQVSKVRVRLGY